MENVTGYLRPFRVIISLLDKPEIGKRTTETNVLHFSIYMSLSFDDDDDVDEGATLRRSPSPEQRAAGGGQGVLQLLPRDAGGGQHLHLEPLQQPAGQVGGG